MKLFFALMLITVNASAAMIEQMYLDREQENIIIDVGYRNCKVKHIFSLRIDKGACTFFPHECRIALVEKTPLEDFELHCHKGMTETLKFNIKEVGLGTVDLSGFWVTILGSNNFDGIQSYGVVQLPVVR